MRKADINRVTNDLSLHTVVCSRCLCSSKCAGWFWARTNGRKSGRWCVGGGMSTSRCWVVIVHLFIYPAAARTQASTLSTAKCQYPVPITLLAHTLQYSGVYGGHSLRAVPSRTILYHHHQGDGTVYLFRDFQTAPAIGGLKSGPRQTCCRGDV